MFCLLLYVCLLQLLEVVLQQRVERGGQQVLVQDFIGSSIGAQSNNWVGALESLRQSWLAVVWSVLRDDACQLPMVSSAQLVPS